MFREIRGVEQRGRALARRWFQDEWFDLFVWQEPSGLVVRFQLAYARDTRRERLLEWQRGRRYQHRRVRQGYDRAAGRRDAGELAPDGVMPYLEVQSRFEQAAPGLPADLARFIADKVRDYARPARRFPRQDRAKPAWLRRLRDP